MASAETQPLRRGCSNTFLTALGFGRRFKCVLSTFKGFLSELFASLTAVGKVSHASHPLEILFLACSYSAYTH